MNSNGLDRFPRIFGISRRCLPILVFRGRGWGTKEQSPEIIKLDETESAHAITDSRKAPDKSHPNLLETAVGPESPRTVSPVTTSQ